jgi:hypothetical protein
MAKRSKADAGRFQDLVGSVMCAKGRGTYKIIQVLMQDGTARTGERILIDIELQIPPEEAAKWMRNRRPKFNRTSVDLAYYIYLGRRVAVSQTLSWLAKRKQLIRKGSGMEASYSLPRVRGAGKKKAAKKTKEGTC